MPTEAQKCTHGKCKTPQTARAYGHGVAQVSVGPFPGGPEAERQLVSGPARAKVHIKAIRPGIIVPKAS